MRLLLSASLFLGLVAALLFGCAGRLDLPFFWAYLGLLVLVAVAFGLTTDPGLQQERLGPGSGRKALGFRLALMPLMLTHFVVAGLDAGRFHWSGAVPPVVQIAALIGAAAGLGLVLWAMVANRFFSAAVRIQQERGHHVVSSGPYRLVRHPGYVGVILFALCSGSALGSWWAMLPVAGYVALILRRAAAEDRFLRADLEGYGPYAERVRYRLLPGIW